MVVRREMFGFYYNIWKVSVWILVVLRLLYEYWLCGGQCMDIGCVEVSVWILVVRMLEYE